VRNDQDPELMQLRGLARLIGTALGLEPRTDETYPVFARRCAAQAKLLRASAGITWADYALVKAEKGEAVFMLKKPPDSMALGGPRWTVTVSQGLEELAGKLGMYEDTQV